MPYSLEPRWKWAVLVGSFFAMFIGDGWLSSFGMIYSNLLDIFGESRAATSYVPSLLFGVPMTLSPFACSIATRLGCRALGIFGGVVLCFSFIITSLCNSLWIVCLVIGFLTSFGLKSLFVSAVVSVTYWFEKGSRGLALGISCTGSGLGSVVFPHLIDWLMELFGWRGTFLIVAGIALNATISGCLYRPFPLNNILLMNFKEESAGEALSGANKFTNTLKVDIIDSKSSGVCNQLKNVFLGCAQDCKLLLKDKIFCLYCFINYNLWLWLNIPYLYTYDWALESGEMNKEECAWLLSTVGISLTIGQLVIGFVADRRGVSSNFLFGICTVFCGVSTVLIPFCTHYIILLVCCAFFGFTGSVTFVLPLLCIGEVIGMERAVAGLGVIHFVEGVAISMGTPLGGWIRDWRGSYNVAFYIAGFFMIINGAIFCFLSRYLVSREKKDAFADRTSFKETSEPI